MENGTAIRTTSTSQSPIGASETIRPFHEPDDNLTAAESISTASFLLNGLSDKKDLAKESASTTDKAPSRPPPKLNLSGWRKGVSANITTISVILAINIVFIIWAQTTHRGKGIIFRSDCKRVESWMLVAHALINILGSLVIGASNYAMQVLLSPTREEVDKAHATRKWVYIGGQSFRNMRHVAPCRTFLWVLIALSSVPFHLMYNSIIYQVTGANSYYSILVSSTFLNGSFYNISQVSVSSNYSYSTEEFISAFENLHDQAKNGTLRNLSVSDCSGAYSTSIQNNYKNVFVVLNDTFAENSIVDASLFLPSDLTAGSWRCRKQTAASDTYPCSTGDIVRRPRLISSSLETFWNGTSPTIDALSVSYCLAEEFTSNQCSLRFNSGLTIVVILANILKLVCMLFLLWTCNIPTFVTMGDAVASYLDHPESKTRGYPLATITFFGHARRRKMLKTKDREEALLLKRSHGKSDRQSNRLRKVSSKPWLQNAEGGQYHSNLWSTSWASAVSRSTGLAAFFFYIVILTGVAVLLGLNIADLQDKGLDTSFASLSSLGFGRARTDTIVNSELPGDVTSLAMLVNIPQLLLSIGYLFFNRMVTAMVTSHEWSQFAHQRKQLRVSRPKGNQKSTYWLQLPMRYSVLLLVVSGALHYVVSQSLFLVMLDVAAPVGSSTDSFATLGYSVIAQITGVIISLIVIITGLGLGFVQNKSRIPPAMNSSAIVSAVCHPPPWDMDASLDKVQWGDVGRYSDTFRDEMEEGDIDESVRAARHCSFSGGIVGIPRDGSTYL